MFKEIWIGFSSYSAIMLVASCFVLLTQDWRSAALGMVAAAAVTLSLNLLLLFRSALLEGSAVVGYLGKSAGAAAFLFLCSGAFVRYLANPLLGMLLSVAVGGFLYSRILRIPTVAEMLTSLRRPV